MWGVGVISYILLSGIMPFDDDCRSRLYTHIITANYVYYPQVRQRNESENIYSNNFSSGRDRKWQNNLSIVFSIQIQWRD